MDETFEDLLDDVEEMLGRFGIRFKDPLEILVDWAKKVFKEFSDAWKEEESQTHHEAPGGRWEKRRSMVEEIEEELQRLKQQNPSSGTSKKTTAGNFKSKKQQSRTASPEIDRELENLKKKYGKSR
ncbi:MAG: hypothetical protein HQM13_07855 [SAR324 cluster bacterium]|nr:hypothetical protein [SAR324 cluster bacterium]